MQIMVLGIYITRQANNKGTEIFNIYTLVIIKYDLKIFRC